MVKTNQIKTGRVYCIRSPNTDKLYIGSTIQALSQRMAGHRTKRNKCSSSLIIDCGNAYIELIELMQNPTKEQLTAREMYYIRHDEYNQFVVNIIGNRVCPHERRHAQCKECGGTSICEHNRERYKCKECGGANICEHNKQRNTCKECGGASICEHNNHRNTCKECGGSGICEHNKQRTQCKECGGSSICEHNKQRLSCKECNPWECSSCNKTFAKSKMKRHLKTSKHRKTFAKEMKTFIDRETENLKIDILQLNIIKQQFL